MGVSRTGLIVVLAMLACPSKGQEGASPTLLPETAWDRPLPLVLLDLSLLPIENLRLRLVDLSPLGWEEEKLNLDILALKGLDAGGADWLLVADRKYNRALEDWEERYDAALDYVTVQQYRLVPAWCTDLGRQRAALWERISAEGGSWSAETMEAWRAYHRDLGLALRRRERLGTGRR